MFYSAQILAKKGPLGAIWIAAHHDKKYLKKQQVSGTDILESCGASLLVLRRLPASGPTTCMACHNSNFAIIPLCIGMPVLVPHRRPTMPGETLC